ncbi:MAG TPA: hypothetical protein VGG29_00660 [Caulobacteraceae bacterium]|jgi:hypothetical protein
MIEHAGELIELEDGGVLGVEVVSTDPDDVLALTICRYRRVPDAQGAFQAAPGAGLIVIPLGEAQKVLSAAARVARRVQAAEEAGALRLDPEG